MRNWIFGIFGRQYRRRRLWRYVSPRRRGLATALLALLASLLLAYWYMTNDARIRQEATSYLRRTTGAVVSIGSAHFSLFGGVTLEGVRVGLPGEASDEPLFAAETVVFQHRPWTLLFSGRLEPTQIVCLRPRVTASYDSMGRQINTARFLELLRSRHGGGGGAIRSLPPIRVREGLLRRLEIASDGSRRVTQEPLNITLVPHEGHYLISFEGEREEGRVPISGSLLVNVGTGEIVAGGGQVPMPYLRQALPSAYRQHLQRYGIDGDMLRVERADGDDPSAWNVELVNIRLTLPQEEGSLELADVNGRLELSGKGVAVRDLRGRLVQAGGADVVINGRYHGFLSDSPFDLEIKAQGVTLPPADAVTGALAGVLGRLHRMLKPEGAMDLDVRIWRGAQGPVQLEGQARPRGMAITYRRFPCRVEDVSGQVDFDLHQVRMKDMTGRRGQGRVTVNGWASYDDDGPLEVLVSASAQRLDDELRDALDRSSRRVWDSLSPSGQAGGQVRVWRQAEGEDHHVAVRLLLDGQAQAAYEEFPYRLEALRGQVRIEGDTAHVENVSGRRGQGRFRINGTVDHIHTSEPTVELLVDAADVPLDEALASALPARAGAAVRSLNAAGLAERISARVSQAGDGPLDHEVHVTLNNVAFCPDAFPYVVESASGVLSVLPGRVVIERLTGRAGGADLHISGQAFLDDEVALDLLVTAKAARFDKELRDALPAALQDLWRRLGPGGHADVRLAYRDGRAGQAGHYSLELTPLEMSLDGEDLPGGVRKVQGRLVAADGAVTFENLTGQWNQAGMTLSGTLAYDDAGVSSAELSLAGRDVAIDRQLLDALPAELAPLVAEIDAQGTLAVNFKTVRLRRRTPGDPAPPGDQAETQPAPVGGGEAAMDWEIAGAMDLAGARVRLGLDPKTVSGAVEGAASCRAGVLTLDARLELSEVVVDNRRLTDLRGRLVKGPAAVLRVDDISAKFHGGEVAGSAEILLRRPLQYGLRASFQNIQLNDLFNAGIEDEEKRINIEGLLGGRVQFIDVQGEPAATRAAGDVYVTRARLTRLPVMLDVLHLLPLSAPHSSAFAEADLSYSLHGRLLTLQEVHLRSPKVSLLGSGTVNLTTRAVRMNFLNGPKLPRMASIDELLVGVVSGIAGIRVTGTISEPRMQPTTIGNLEEAIRQLYAPTRDDGR